MRSLVVGGALACIILTGAQAAPWRSMSLVPSATPAEQIRWTCNQYRCLDQWTGNESPAFCDDDGCHPVKGFARRETDYGYAPPPRRFGYGYRYAPPPPLDYGYEDD